jgi:hypothetical protein
MHCQNDAHLAEHQSTNLPAPTTSSNGKQSHLCYPLLGYNKMMSIMFTDQCESDGAQG